MTWNLHCMFFVHTNNAQTIQNLCNLLTETASLCFLYIQTMYKLYKMYINVNQIIYAPADVCLMYTTPVNSLLFKFLHEQQHHLPFYFGYFIKFPILKKIHRWIYIIDLFSINLTYFNFDIFSIFYLSFSKCFWYTVY